MSGISSYQLKSQPDGSDIVIGTSVENGQTKNFSVQSLSNYSINSYLKNISWQFVVLEPDPSERAEGTISFENFGGQNTNWSAITRIYINTLMPNGSASINYLTRLVGKNIILGDRNNLDGYGIFKVTSLTQESGSVYYIDLSYKSGSGVIKALRYYGLQVDIDGVVSDKNFVFTQGVPATTWNIPHNLAKFPSVTVINNNNVVITGEVTYIDNNNVQLNFSAGFSGKAYLN
jgi:hypothetical protein